MKKLFVCLVTRLKIIFKQISICIGRVSRSVISLVTMVMGIPTVKRKVKSYLAETLRSLIDKLSPEEKLDCVIIVYVGEVRSHMHNMSHSVSLLQKLNWTVRSPQTDVEYVHSVVAGLEKEWVHVQRAIFWRCENTQLMSACVIPWLTSPMTSSRSGFPQSWIRACWRWSPHRLPITLTSPTSRRLLETPERESSK